MRPISWLLPVLWMAIIMWFSTDVGSAEHTEGWLFPILRALAPWATPAQLQTVHGLVRKGAHLSEYAILAALWLRALARGRAAPPPAAAWIAFAISLAWAILDEAHQSLVPTRTASATDVAIDGAGALLAVVVGRLGWRRAAEGATVLLLWAAVVGGGAALALNVFAGVSSGPLWLTTPLGAGALLGRRLWSIRRRSLRP